MKVLIPWTTIPGFAPVPWALRVAHTQGKVLACCKDLPGLCHGTTRTDVERSTGNDQT